MKYNGWFVNPHNSNQAVNLTVTTAIELSNTRIVINHVKIWQFQTKVEAARVFEAMIRSAQE